MERVVGLDDVFPAIVQMAIAEQKAETSGGEIVLVILLDGVRDQGDAGAILRAMPPGPAGAQAHDECLVDLRVRERFGLAVVPSGARKGGQVVRQGLLNVDAEPVFAGNVPRVVGDVRRDTGGGSFDDLIAVDAHVRVVRITQSADHAGLAGDNATTQFVFEIFGVGLPGPPHEIDAVGD